MSESEWPLVYFAQIAIPEWAVDEEREYAEDSLKRQVSIGVGDKLQEDLSLVYVVTLERWEEKEYMVEKIKKRIVITGMKKVSALQMAIQIMADHRRRLYSYGARCSQLSIPWIQRDTKKAQEINQAIEILEELIKLIGDGP